MRLPPITLFIPVKTTDDSRSVAEFCEVHERDAKEIESLGICLRRAESYAKSAITTTIVDTVIVRDSLPEPYRYFAAADAWSRVVGILYDDSLSYAVHTSTRCIRLCTACRVSFGLYATALRLSARRCGRRIPIRSSSTRSISSFCAVSTHGRKILPPRTSYREKWLSLYKS